MQVTDWQTFVSMYQALDAAYDEGKSQKVFAFIADANPNIWKGRVSGDPAVFSEFSETFAERFSQWEGGSRRRRGVRAGIPVQAERGVRLGGRRRPRSVLRLRRDPRALGASPFRGS